MTAFRTISSRRLQEDDGSSSWSTYQLTAFLVLIFVLIVAVTYSFVGTRQSRTLWYKRCFEWDWTARVELHILTRSYPIGDPRHRTTKEEAEKQVKQFICRRILPFTKTLEENDFIKDGNDEKDFEQNENYMVEKEPVEYGETMFDGTSSRVLNNRAASLHTTTLSSSTDHVDTLHTFEEEEINTNELTKVQTGMRLKRVRFSCPDISLDSQREKDFDVSVDCAICLNAYSIGDRVTSSSGLSNCTHAFHQDCIVEWLMTIGKKAQRDAQEATGNGSIPLINLCNIPMICPICRQDFIPN